MAKDTMKISEKAYERNVSPIITPHSNKNEVFINDIFVLNWHVVLYFGQNTNEAFKNKWKGEIIYLYHPETLDSSYLWYH